MIKKIISVFLAFMLSLTIVNAESVDFSVTSAKVLEKSGTMEAVAPSFSSNNVNSNSFFKVKNDYVVYNITLKNNESEEYKLIDIEDNNTNEYVDVTYESDKDVIAANDTVTVNVKIKYSTLLKNLERQDLNDFDVILVLENENGDIELLNLYNNSILIGSMEYREVYLVSKEYENEFKEYYGQTITVATNNNEEIIGESYIFNTKDGVLSIVDINDNMYNYNLNY